MNSCTQDFPCKENGCGGLIKNGVDLLVPLRTGCHNISLAVRCPKCGRLHWPNSGTSVLNRIHEKAFFIDGSIVNKPLSFEEHSDLVSKCLSQYEREVNDSPDQKEKIIESMRIAFLSFLECSHTSDCSLMKGDNECNCGYSIAAKWLEEHPEP